jgi:hypothetical protein
MEKKTKIFAGVTAAAVVGVGALLKKAHDNKKVIKVTPIEPVFEKSAVNSQ